MYRLESIHLYPVKSLGGYPVDECELMEKGPRGDRRYMLVDDNNQHLTQREIPTFALFKVRPDGKGFRVTFAGDSMTLSYALEAGTQLTCKVWDDNVDVIEAPKSVSDWFSQRAGQPVRLVYFPESNPRPVDQDYRVAEEQVGLADGYPVLVIGIETLSLLNSKLASPVPMNRFRPNLVFAGGGAHDEDRWKDFAIGDTLLRGVKPCARCAVPTVDQETGQMGKEPSATLASYRRFGNKILFGENTVVLQPGTIRVGETIKVITWK